MKKVILYLLIATFCISAILGIGIIVLDLWNDLTAKVLITTATIFGFSIPALCCSTIYEKEEYYSFSIIGVFVSIVSGIYCLLYVWEILDYTMFPSDFSFNSIITGIMISVSLGHLSLMLLIDSKDVVVKRVKMLTIIVSLILLVSLSLLIWVEDFEEVLAWQFYVIDGILVVLGTIVTPILSKARKQGVVLEVSKKSEEEEMLNHLLAKEYITKEEYDRINERIKNKNV